MVLLDFDIYFCKLFLKLMMFLKGVLKGKEVSYDLDKIEEDRVEFMVVIVCFYLGD